MSQNISTDDGFAADDKYAWTKASNLSLDDFLSKYKPSMVQNDGTKPWIWVKGSDPSKGATGEAEAKKEAQVLLKGVTDRIKEIQHDSSIPFRANKKTGTRSKKDLREEAQVGITEKLKGIAVKHGYVSGKWLMFVPSDKVDFIWRKIATSLVSGPLSTTAAWLAKVATSPEGEVPNYQHLICVYIPDVYNKETVIEVMKVLLRNHGVSLSGVKSDLYTAIGIDSKHLSGIPSTIWKNTALLKDTEIKALKDEFWDVQAGKIDTVIPSSAKDNSSNKGESSKGVTTAESTGSKGKSKPKPKLKKGKDDPFASDDDGQEKGAEKERKQLLKEKKVIQDVKRSKAASDEDEEEEEEEEGPKHKKAKVSK